MGQKESTSVKVLDLHTVVLILIRGIIPCDAMCTVSNGSRGQSQPEQNQVWLKIKLPANKQINYLT